MRGEPFHWAKGLCTTVLGPRRVQQLGLQQMILKVLVVFQLVLKIRLEALIQRKSIPAGCRLLLTSLERQCPSSRPLHFRRDL